MKLVILSAVSVAMLAGAAAFAIDRKTSEPKSASAGRGRYLVQISACNDCHTSGYAESGGKIPESEWLKGDHIGWRGPWGTTYPPNLRQYFARVAEDAFITDARSGRMRPPMPWFNLRDMTDDDLRSIHRYVRGLEVAGAQAPAYVPPGQEPATPYFILSPQEPKSPQASAR